MVDDIFDAIEDFFIGLLSDWVQSSLVRASETLSGIVDLLSENVTKTPDQWNNTVFTTLKSISDTAILPVATAIMAIIICYDLISACMERNSMKDIDYTIFFKFSIKGWAAIYFLNNAFTISGALFQIGGNIAQVALGKLFTAGANINATLSSSEFHSILQSHSMGDLLMTGLLSMLVYIISVAVVVIVMVVTAGRMIEMLIYFSVAPIPFAAMTNKEWNSIGYSFLKNLLALALQAFFIVITLAIYMILFNANVQNITASYNSLSSGLFSWICYSVVCCFMLLKTGSISKSICGAR